MMESLPKNGSFVQRRKVFVEFPFHSLNHHLPFNWTDDDKYSNQKQRMHNRQKYEHQYIRQVYNDKIQRKLKEKFGSQIDTFRIFPNQFTTKQDQDVLTKELQYFNHAKLASTTNPEHQEAPNNNMPTLQPSHQSAQQLYNKPPVDPRYHPYPSDDNYNSNSRAHNSNNSISQYPQNQKQPIERVESPRYDTPKNSSSSQLGYQGAPLDLYRRHYIPSNYGPQSLNNYRKYADAINSTNLESPNHPLRNYLPEPLQGYLRQKSKVQRKRPLNASLSLGNRQKI